ncbi:MAG: hypothetical protein A3B31_01160 [Candidatus Komeilibacteria bacterium RIFCSPLOWO2_01_FULL_53_11]|uniref:Uncharacterized protein n=1 Tax=Candidatus Komeilibacteria bacterium RIFCSPLOWO2_01_FULL_53_11 TaxID=1798552 RepID=A0A1G2BTL1_9BACT|nr:MAG: hypothetical protein A3B31_01160 [Candidatus Komeilibacteria bacterium RIFCSPLOWO2_01_FULL_53_11]
MKALENVVAYNELIGEVVATDHAMRRFKTRHPELQRVSSPQRDTIRALLRSSFERAELITSGKRAGLQTREDDTPQLTLEDRALKLRFVIDLDETPKIVTVLGAFDEGALRCSISELIQQKKA